MDNDKSSRGSDLQKFAQAFVEAAAPELRLAVNGQETSEERFKKELEYQLKARNVREEDRDG